MFRLSQFMRDLVAPPAAPEHRRPAGAPPPGPVVIWNLVRRCNLSCLHCYAYSADVDFPGELTTDQVFSVMDDLKAFRVPVLILSGGEPLMRKDIFEISQRAKARGFYVGLSTNGTLIDEQRIGALAAVGYDYVGISLDGLEATHDRFRRRAGAYRDALRGMRLCRSAGLKVGLRLTLTEANAAQLPEILGLMVAEGVNKFYLSHLNFAGRGNHNRGEDARHASTRLAMEALFEAAYRDALDGADREYVTGNNDADAVFLLHWAQRRFPAERVVRLRSRLVRWGGNASGINIANIDNLGDVHPDTMWRHHTLGNVTRRRFGEIWTDTAGDPLFAGLKRRPRPVTGRCGACAFLDICNGNTRVRSWQATGDPWGPDPSCYLSTAEVGAEVRELVHA